MQLPAGTSAQVMGRHALACLTNGVPLVAACAVTKGKPLVTWLTVSELNAGKGKRVDLGGIAPGVVDNIVEVICQLWFYLKRHVACMLRSLCLSCPWTLCTSAAPFLPETHCYCMPASVALLQPAAHMPLHWPALTGLAAACSTVLLLHRPVVTGCALLQYYCPLWCDHHRADLVLLQGGQWSSAHLAAHCLGQQGPFTAGSCVIHHEQGMG